MEYVLVITIWLGGQHTIQATQYVNHNTCLVGRRIALRNKRVSSAECIRR
jgi:hypothetical protein